MDQNAQVTDTQQPNGVMGLGPDNLPMSMPIGFRSHDLLFNSGGQGGYEVIGSGLYPNVPGHAPLDVEMDHLDWAAMDWGFEGVYPGVWDAEL